MLTHRDGSPLAYTSASVRAAVYAAKCVDAGQWMGGTTLRFVGADGLDPAADSYGPISGYKSDRGLPSRSNATPAGAPAFIAGELLDMWKSFFAALMNSGLTPKISDSVVTP